MSDGAQIYPQTHTKAVIDDNGYTAESRLQAMQDEINQAQLEIGAIPSDLTPTENSTNWVTSGGVYNAYKNIDVKVNGNQVDIEELSYIELYEGKIIKKSSGELVDASSDGANVKVYDTTGYNIVFASGYYPSASGANTGIAYYDENRNFLSYQSSSGNSAFNDLYLQIPSEAKYVYLFGTSSALNSAKVPIDYIFRSVSLVSDIYKDEEIVPRYKTYVTYIVDKNNGGLVKTSSETAVVNEFYLEYEDSIYFIDGRISPNASCCLIAYYDDKYNFISYEQGGTGIQKVFFHFKITPPANATIVRILGNQNATLTPNVIPAVYVMPKKEKIVTPQLFNKPYKTKNANDNLKILLFGSSWFQTTWWYLNYMIQNVGINAEIHAYYMGHSQFREWIELYNNELTPFTGEESTRSATKNISINGAAWSTTTYGTNYTAQQYRDDFYNDITSWDWDIIAFQQGAYQSPHWRAYWKPYIKDILRIIKENCSPNTIIAFNSTWAMAKTSTSLAPYPVSADGQRQWQIANWDATKRFLKESGIDNISPNGKVMWNLRNSELENSSDLAGDGIHPSNGLPIYATGLCFFQTYIAPMYGIDGDSISWLPTSSTPKAPVSGSYYVSMSEEQRALVHKLVKKAMGNRFDFD